MEVEKMDIPDTGDREIDGIRIGTAAANIRYEGRDDIAVFELSAGTTTAATFTLNRFAAAPVVVAKDHLSSAASKYLLINAGNANAGTGEQGMKDALQSCGALAKAAGCQTSEVLPFSTGVIGEYLPMDKLTAGSEQALSNLGSNNWEAAANAILTTDTTTKIYSHEFTLNGEPCRMTGIAKGSGMIQPNMATMLAFVAIDAAAPQPVLQKALQAAVEESFNCITVDGDTSTNDACVVCATGKGPVTFTDNELEVQVLAAKLTLVCQKLAELIVLDGEGATKTIYIQVEGGRKFSECRTVGLTVANSPLVKTAFHGEDANWGRILAAIGRAPIEDFDINQVDIYLDEIPIVSNGEREKYYVEEDGARVMKRKSIIVRINLNMGDAEAEVITTDLSHEYININADYRS